MNRRNLVWLIVMAVMSNPAWADMQLNLTEGVTEISKEVYDLHMFAMYICTAIGIIVFGAMFWSMWFHRKSKGAKAASFHESTTVEILWTAIPIIILIVMAVPATTTLIDMENNEDSDLTIQITGSQWKWHYKYFDQDIEFYSVLTTPKEQYDDRQGNSAKKGENYLLEVDRHLVIPANKKVRFLITSDDVIHSWWVPAFAVKQDANPGFINEAWANVPEPGMYRGQCAELCGKDHGYMPVVVEVKTEADYKVWIEEQNQLIANAAAEEAASLNAEASMEELMQLGETTYTAYCAACHQANGQGLPPAFPALKASPLATTGDINEHIRVVFDGRSGTGMQGYGKQLSLKEIAAVVTYERNAWENNTGDAVQASDVNAAMGGAADASSANETTDVEEAADTATQVAEEVVEDLAKTYSKDELMTMGEEVYNSACGCLSSSNRVGACSCFPRT